MQFRTSRGFEWTRLELPVPGLSPALDGLRIVHLADLHCRPRWDGAYDDLLGRLERQPPDLILFGGDFVESKRDARPALPILRKLLPRLKSRLGTFAVLGNHDGDLVGPPLAGCGVTFIDHRRLLMESGGAAIELIGLPGVDRLDLDLHWVNALPGKEPRTLRIVLCHYPDILPTVAGLHPDLYLAGHTHGGQVALPNRLPILRHDSLPRRLCSGIHRVYGTVLVANRGFGFSSPLPLR
ncbi:MAG: metallophosphoesterase, partial [Tepidisphaeraceae bacterium]